MASVTVDLSGVGLAARKVRVPVTPSTPLSSIRDQACTAGKLTPSSRYGLTFKRTSIDLSLPFRLANLPANCRLDLVKVAPPKASRVNVALDVEPPGGGPSQRVVRTHPSTTSLWNIMSGAEDGFGPGALTAASDADGMYLKPSLSFMNQAAGDDWHRTTLSSLGLTGGSVLLRLRFERTSEPLEQVLPRLQKLLEAQSAGVASTDPKEPRTAEKTAPPKPSTKAAPTSNEPTSAATGHQNSKTTAETTPNAAVPVNDSSSKEGSSTSTSTRRPFEREVRIFRASESQTDISRIEIPDDFYDYSEGDLRGQLAQQARKAKEEEQKKVLMTRQMRERLQEKKMAKFKKCTIRVRLPDRACIQANFRPTENMSAVYDFVRSQMRSPHQSFYLYVTPPVQRLDPGVDSLRKLGLVPAALMYLSSNATDSSLLLTDDALQAMETLPVVEPSPVAPQSDSNSTGPEGTTVPEHGSGGAPPASTGTRHGEEHRSLRSEAVVVPAPSTSARSNGHRDEAPRGVVPKWFRPQ